MPGKEQHEPRRQQQGDDNHRCAPRPRRRAAANTSGRRFMVPKNGLLVLAFIAAFSCRANPPEEIVIQTVEVDDPTAGIVPDFDAKEKRQGRPALIGFLPGNFPIDLPFYTPSTLVDLAQEGGRGLVVIDTGRPVPEIERWYRNHLGTLFRETDKGRWRDAAEREIEISARQGAALVRYSYPEP